MANVAEKVFDLIKDEVEKQNVTLWDVKFVKEGASWYLRVFIDKPEGISIDDCTDVSHAIDPIIDEADPIDTAYYLEVCSPGIERELNRPFHFKSVIGSDVKLKFYKAINGKKEYSGKLVSFDESGVLAAEDTEIEFTLKDISKATLLDF